MFNIQIAERNRRKSKNNKQNSPFYNFIFQDIIDRLEPIDRNFGEILLINPVVEDKLLSKKYPDHKLTTIESIEQISSITKKFDLVIFTFGLHWVSDVQLLLKQIYEILKTNGIFICNFPSSGTLHQLRRKLIQLESEAPRGHAAHISPFIQFEHMTPLLQQAGFAENIIDMESIELEYETPLLLMKALQSYGESNALAQATSYSLTKDMYRKLNLKQDKPFIDNVNLITFISSKTKRSIKLIKKHFK